MWNDKKSSLVDGGQDVASLFVHMKFEVPMGNASENGKYWALGVRSVDLRTDV